MDGGGQRSLASLVGIFLSLILTLFVSVYAVQKFDILLSKKDNEIMMTELKYYYDDSEAITGQDGFNLSFRLLTADETEIDATYGFF